MSFYGDSEKVLAGKLFAHSIELDYGTSGRMHSTTASRIDPMDDPEISEIVWDVLCLVYSRGKLEEGITPEEIYYKDVKRFKEKWFKEPRNKRLIKYIDDKFRVTQAECVALIGGYVNEEQSEK